ncbi:hypothetical protein GGR52DRAFT_586861 [Hypoxylon sp. FL1284]|nr:hypothetical protein GGR52DRAFT_586861 [Hypoxylon sp. FL1284]
MSHQPPSQAAIFSPSVARAAASAAKDWSYVDGWLRARYGGGRGKPPAFERNPDTLRALLALAAASEAADEDRDRLARVEEAALSAARDAERERDETRIRQQQQGKESSEAAPDGDLLAADLLTALESSLSSDGRTALDALASVAVSLGDADPTPASLGSRFATLRGRALEAEDAAARVDLVRRYVDREAARVADFLAELQRGDDDHDHDRDGSGGGGGSGAYRQAPDLARQNLELQRRVRAASARLPELRQQVAALEERTGLPSLTVEEVRGDEEAYLELLAAKKDLDAQVKAFAGLPPDVEAARAELEALRAELRDVTEQRDTNFERLVERESPLKSRRRP